MIPRFSDWFSWVRFRNFVPLLFLLFSALLFWGFLGLFGHFSDGEKKQNLIDQKRLQVSILRNGLADLLDRGAGQLAEKRLMDAALDLDIRGIALLDDRAWVLAASRREWLGRSAESIEGFQSAYGVRARSEGSDLVFEEKPGQIRIYYPFVKASTMLHGKKIQGYILYADLDLNQRLVLDAVYRVKIGMYYSVVLILASFLLYYLIGIFFDKKFDKIISTLQVAENGSLQVRTGLNNSDELSLVGASLDRFLDHMSLNLKSMGEDLRFLDTILESIPMMVFVKSGKDLKFVKINRAAEELLGMKREELLGKNDFDIFPPEQAEFFVSKDREVLDGKRMVDVMEEPIQTRYRGMRTLHTLKVPVMSDDGQSRYLIGISEDITERIAFEQQAARSQKMDSLGSLAGGVAHDMNNVLSAIMGLASIHAETAEPGSRLQRCMETIQKACERGAALVRGLLGFARQELSEEHLCHLNSLVHEVVANIKPTTQHRIEVEVELDPLLKPIKGDPAVLSHVLMNLCVNAVEAMPQTGTLSLRTLNDERGGVRLEVSDTGCGMSPEVLSRSLEPFFTTKPVGQGAGLGLSIVYGAIKAHKGNLDIQSTLGEGTVVRLYFPSCEAWSKAAPLMDVAAGTHQVRRVLLVDDDDLVQQATGLLLERLGHLTTLVDRGEDAIKVLETGQSVDLVILDLNMPGMDGIETLRRIRALRENLPVILSTGRMDQSAYEAAHSVLYVKLLPKPFTLDALRRVMAEIKFNG